MTEEERRRAELNAKYGDPIPQAAPTVDEETRRMELNAKFGDPTVVAQEAPPPEEPGFLQQAKHIAKGVGRGMLDTVDIGYNLEQLADQGLKWAGVEGGLPGETSTTKPSDAIPQSWQEVIAGREFDREGNEKVDSARTAAEWAGPGLIPKAIRKAGNKLPEILAGGGAAAGQYIDDWFGEDSVIGQMVGGLLGGVAGGVRRSADQIDAQAASIVQDVIDLDPGSRKVLEASLAAGDVGTLGDLAVDAGLSSAQTTRLLDLEGGLKSKYQDSRIAFNDKEGLRAQQVADRTADVFDADVSTTGGLEAAKAQLASRNAKIDSGVTTARGRVIDDTTAAMDKLDESVQAAERQLEGTNQALGVADETLATANQAIDTPLSSADASIGVDRALSEGEKAFIKSDVQPAWDAHDQAGKIDVTDVNATVKQYLNSLSPVDKKKLLKKYESEINIYKLWETPTPDKLDSFTGRLTGAEAPPPKRTPTADPKEVSTYISDMKKAAAETRASATGGGRPEKLLDDLYNAVDDAYTVQNPLYGAAQAKTAEKFKRFSPGKVGKARRGDEAELFTQKLPMEGQGGALATRLLGDADIPTTQPALTEVLRAAAADAGGVTPAFMRQYRSVLDKLPPAVRQEFQAAVDATEGQASALKQTTAAQNAAVSARAKAESGGLKEAATKETQLGKVDRRKQGLQNTRDKNIVTKYANSPTKTIKDLAMGEDSAGELKRLYDFQVKQGQGDSFKAAVYESLADNDMNKGTELGKSVRKNLVDSGILTADEADKASSALARNKSSALRKSSIASKLDAYGGTGNETDNLLASLGSAVIVGGLPGSQSLLVGGAVRRKLRQMLVQRGTKPAELKRIEEFLLDPQEFLGPGLKAKDANEAIDIIMTKIVGRAQATALAAEEED